MMDKPLISRVPLSWLPGFHRAHEGGMPVGGLYLVHLRWFDIDAALVKGGYYRSSKWNPHDVETGLAEYQRADEQQIVTQFESQSIALSTLTATRFDGNAQLTTVPDWMRETIFI
jgi:hypothetical protein